MVETSSGEEADNMNVDVAAAVDHFPPGSVYCREQVNTVSLFSDLLLDCRWVWNWGWMGWGPEAVDLLPERCLVGLPR